MAGFSVDVHHQGQFGSRVNADGRALVNALCFCSSFAKQWTLPSRTDEDVLGRNAPKTKWFFFRSCERNDKQLGGRGAVLCKVAHAFSE
eukprot:1166836-Amphidinium_carterae.2